MVCTFPIALTSGLLTVWTTFCVPCLYVRFLARHLVITGKDGPSAEQQQTLDVMKRILEIKRMVTEGASGNSSSGASPGGSRPGAPGGRVSSSSGRGEGDEGKFVKPASGGEGEPVGEQCGQVWPTLSESPSCRDVDLRNGCRHVTIDVGSCNGLDICL